MQVALREQWLKIENDFGGYWQPLCIPREQGFPTLGLALRTRWLVLGEWHCGDVFSVSQCSVPKRFAFVVNLGLCSKTRRARTRVLGRRTPKQVAI